jgi:ribosomal protein S18 acetylase RimI-like enzyme
MGYSSDTPNDTPKNSMIDAVELARFDPALAPQVSRWARSRDEVLAWCSRREAPVPADVIAGWGLAPGVLAYGLLDNNGQLVGYGELWVDADEAEVELAHLIVDPDQRGQGIGRRLAAALAVEAGRIQPTVCLRVRPENEIALRSYAAAGFQRVAPAEEAAWNEHQPIAYAWLTYSPA